MHDLDVDSVGGVVEDEVARTGEAVVAEVSVLRVSQEQAQDDAAGDEAVAVALETITTRAVQLVAAQESSIQFAQSGVARRSSSHSSNGADARTARRRRPGSASTGGVFTSQRREMVADRRRRPRDELNVISGNGHRGQLAGRVVSPRRSSRGGSRTPSDRSRSPGPAGGPSAGAPRPEAPLEIGDDEIEVIDARSAHHRHAT